LIGPTDQLFNFIAVCETHTAIIFLVNFNPSNDLSQNRFED